MSHAICAYPAYQGLHGLGQDAGPTAAELIAQAETLEAQAAAAKANAAQVGIPTIRDHITALANEGLAQAAKLRAQAAELTAPDVQAAELIDSTGVPSPPDPLVTLPIVPGTLPQPISALPPGEPFAPELQAPPGGRGWLWFAGAALLGLGFWAWRRAR